MFADRGSSGTPNRSARLLVLLAEDPSPLGTGDRIANFGMLAALAQRFDLTVLPGFDSKSGAPSSDGLLGPSVRMVTPARHATSDRFLRAKRIFRSLVLRQPMRYGTRMHPGVASLLRDLGGEADAIIFLDNYFVMYLSDQLRAPTLIHFHNVDGWSAGCSPPSGLLRQWQYAFELRRIRRVERIAIEAADAVSVTSAAERDRIRRLYGATSIRVVPSGVPVPVSVRRRPVSNRIGWIGSLKYGPNCDGLRRFVANTWPHMCQRHEAQLAIAGSCCPPDIAAMSGTNNIDVLGYVEDEEGFFSTLQAGIVPLWDGAGVKLKTLTMMAYGVPVVSTSVGAEGLTGLSQENMIVVDTDGEFQAALCGIIGNPSRAEVMGECGREFVRSRYSWEVTGEVMTDLVSALLNDDCGSVGTAS